MGYKSYTNDIVLSQVSHRDGFMFHVRNIKPKIKENNQQMGGVVYLHAKHCYHNNQEVDYFPITECYMSSLTPKQAVNNKKTLIDY